MKQFENWLTETFRVSPPTAEYEELEAAFKAGVAVSFISDDEVIRYWALQSQNANLIRENLALRKDTCQEEEE